MFQVSDESVNSYGMRVLSDGGDFTQFNLNPIMLYDHNDYKYLPIGTWSDLKVHDDGKITAEEQFDEGDKFAMSVKSKVDKAIIKMASIGIIPLEWSDDPALMIPGQTEVTITKWALREISITPFGSNKNAFKLYDQAGKQLEFSEAKKLMFNQKNNQKMSTPSNLKVMLAAGLSLSENISDSELIREVLKLHTENVQLKADNKQLKLKADQDAEAIELREKEQYITTAINEKRITLKQKDVYMKLELSDLKTVLTGLPKPESLDFSDDEDGKYKGRENWTFKNWSQKDSDGLAKMKLNDKENYIALFKAEYGKEPKMN